MLSIVIPALDAAETLGACLGSLVGSGIPCEIVVVDGGSRDFTLAVARKFDVQLVAAGPGRGEQLAAGARAASGDWLLFLHPGTVLAPGWPAHVKAFMADPANAAKRAAHFRFAVASPDAAGRRLEALAAWRCHSLGLPLGEQGLLVSRRLLDAVGGVRPLPSMDDVDLARRLGRDHLVRLDVAAVVVPQAQTPVWRALWRLACLGLYMMKVPPGVLARMAG